MRWPESAVPVLRLCFLFCMWVEEGRTNSLERSVGSYCPVCGVLGAPSKYACASPLSALPFESPVSLRLSL